MFIVYLERINAFARNHANARKSLAVWKMVVEKASWKNKQTVLADFPKAKMINRLIAHIHYEDQIVEIRFIGTHNEYDKIDPETI